MNRDRTPTEFCLCLMRYFLHRYFSYGEVKLTLTLHKKTGLQNEKLAEEFMFKI